MLSFKKAFVANINQYKQEENIEGENYQIKMVSGMREFFFLLQLKQRWLLPFFRLNCLYSSSDHFNDFAWQGK